VAEYPHLSTILNDPERLIINIRQPIETYRNPSRPCVIVTAHQSNWEVVCSAMAKMGIPNASLYSPPTNPYLDRLLLDSRRALNCELLPRDNAARLLMRAMKQGRTAGMVIDRRVDEGQPIEFFGRDKLSTIMPARLAQKFHCDLVPVQVERLQDARYRVTFHPPVRPTDTSVDETAQAINMIQQVHRQFEDWIRQQPQDWFCSKRLWWRAKRNPWNSKKEAGRKAGINRHAA
jgi:KDO2-lipid IV(A) lauroyltransferase